MEELAEKAEEAAEMRNTRELYRITKQIAGKKNSCDAPVKDKRGKVLTSEDSQLKRWAEHFKEVLNRPAPTERADIPEAACDPAVKTDPPSRQEIRDAVKKLKANKAPGPDGIPSEAFMQISTPQWRLYSKCSASSGRKKQFPQNGRLDTW